MIMKLKSKDEITVKLIEKLEQHQKCDINDVGERVELDGAINILKWVFGIPQDYTKGENNDD